MSSSMIVMQFLPGISAAVATTTLGQSNDSSNSILDVDTSKESKFYVDELEISLAINASGGVELIGKLEAGAQAGIKIKLKRKEV